MELHYNHKNLKSGFSQENIDNSTFLRKHTPPNATILHLLVYCRPILIYASGQKLDFKIFRFFPIMKSMFSHYNLNKGGEARFSTGKF